MSVTEMIRMKNGSEECSAIVTATTMALRDLWGGGEAIAVVELVSLCKDSQHKLFAGTREGLHRLALLERNGDSFTVHDSVRNVVLSSVEGEGLDMRLVSPVAPEGGPS